MSTPSYYSNQELELLKLILPPNTPLSPQEKKRLLDNCKTVLTKLKKSPVVSSLVNALDSLPNNTSSIIIDDSITLHIIDILKQL